jgi:hypothetical protein
MGNLHPALIGRCYREFGFPPMFTVLRTFVHMLQIAAMVSIGFVLLSLLEGKYAKKLANLISHSILTRVERKAAARSRL